MVVGMNEKRGHDHRAEPCMEDGWVDNDSKWDRSLFSTSLSSSTPAAVSLSLSRSLSLLGLNLQIPLEHFPFFFPAPDPSPCLATVSWD